MCISPKAAQTIKPPAPLPVGNTGRDRQYLAKLRSSNENVELLRKQRLEAFLARQPDFQQEIELEKMRYPYHIIDFKQALKRLNPDEILKISSKSLTLIEDLAACSRILGFPQQPLRYRGRNFLYVTRQVSDFSADPVPAYSINQQKDYPCLIAAAAV